MMRNVTSRLYAYKEHYRALVTLGIPIVVGQIGMIILGFADTFMIGRYGTDELGAASFVNNVFTLVIVFGMGFSYGLTPVVGGLYGNRRFADAGRALRCSLIANTVMALLLTLVMSVLYVNIQRLGQPEELLHLIRPYFLLQLFSLLFVMLFNGFKQFADAITDTRTGMWILLCGNLLNIVGNYLLIGGHLGMPELGLVGAGVSTLTSRVLMVVVFWGVFIRSRRFSRYKVGFFHLYEDASGLLRKLSALGLPIAFQMGMETASFSLCAVMVGWIGTVALASHQVMCTIGQLLFMVYYGIGASVAIRVSAFSGCGDVVNARRSASAGFHIMLLLSVTLSSAVYLFRHALAGIFVTDAEVSAMVETLILPMLLYQFGDSMQTNYANALRGISDVRVMTLMAFVAYFVISLPLSYFFGFTLHLGVFGVWLAFPFGLTSAGIMFSSRFYYMTGKHVI
jgi:MATE family multidrug resistance protein